MNEMVTSKEHKIYSLNDLNVDSKKSLWFQHIGLSRCAHLDRENGDRRADDPPATPQMAKIIDPMALEVAHASPKGAPGGGPSSTQIGLKHSK